MPSKAPASIPPEISAPRRYSAVAITLHWIIAISIGVQIGLGWYMGSLKGPAEKKIEVIHISIGLTVLLLTLARVAWWMYRRPPPMVAALAPWERRLAKAVHALFYLMLFALPLSGWVMESIGRKPIPFWGRSWPHFPGLQAALAGHDARMIKDTLEWTHGTPLAWAMIALVCLHVLGALKHQFDGSPVLWRMIPILKRPV